MDLDVRDATRPASRLDRLYQRPAGATASCLRAYVQILDAGKKGDSGDIEPEGEHGDPEGRSARFRPNREHLDVSRFDGPCESLGERGRHGLAISRELYEDGEGLVELVRGGGSNFDPGTSLVFEGVYGEPGDRLDGGVYLLVADV